MKYTQVMTDAFKKLALNAGIIVSGDSGFVPSTGTVTAANIVCATSGGTTFSATPTYVDFGDDVDNCPKNLKGFKKFDTYEAKLSGTSVTFTDAWIKKLIGPATSTTDSTGDITFSKITLKDTLESSDFDTLWFIADYSDINDDGATTGHAGYIAIKLNNALNTKGFEFKSQDKNKGTGSFEFLCHYDQTTTSGTTTVTKPFEVYIAAGTSTT